MNEIDLRALNQLDLNLLVTFDALLEECHVTRTARRLMRTQSAISHALARLREMLGDPLLVRVGGRMQPTPRALQLAPEVKRVLHTITRMLHPEQRWDPATATRTFTLVAPDFAIALVPKLIAHLNAHAPHVQLHLEAPRRGMLRDVAQRRFDVAIGPVDLPAEEGVTAGQWIELPWVVFARGAHPAIADWSMAAWLRHPHLRIRTDATRSGPVDQALCALGHARAPGPVLPHFMLAPPLLAQTNMLLTVPRGVLSTVAERFDLRALPCPIELAPVRLTVYESTIGALDPAQQWFRGQVEAALMTLG